MTRRPSAQEPSLFDVVEAATSDAWTRAGWQPTPGIAEADLVPETIRRAPRRAKAGPPPADVDRVIETLAARVDAARTAGEDAIRRARARIEHPEEPPDA